MSHYDSEYFFIKKPKRQTKYPFLVPDKNTEGRRYSSERQLPGSPPLVFTNGNKEVNQQSGIVSVTPDVLFAGNDIVVRTAIREKLLALDLSNLSMHPTIYIDDNDNWHEDYFYLTFTAEFDCWDRDTSEYDDDDSIEVGGEELVEVYSYRLDGDVLDARPLNERLLFKMGGDLAGYPCCHSSIRFLFSGTDAGTTLVCLSDQ